MITLVTTVLNAEKEIKDFLNSINSQSKLPDEIVIVDAHSRDKTTEIIRSFKFKRKIPLNLIIRKGNRSIGRNEAIKNAKGNIIACSDVGCILEKDWLKKITEPFSNPGIDVVSGFYKPVTNNSFEKAMAAYTCTMEDKLNDDFLPSSRSIAFRKEAWRQVAGYPEKLNTCEDLIFAKKLKIKGFNFRLEKNAVVYWPQRENYIEAFLQFFNYAKGDGEAYYIRKNTPFLFLRYIIAVILVGYSINSPILIGFLGLLLLVYLIWAIEKNYKYVKEKSAIFHLPLLQLVSDVAVISGMTWGIIRKKRYGL